MRQLFPLLILTMLTGGCYSWTTIKPTELPKLNGASTTSSRNMGRQVVLISVAQVEAPDGRLVEIQGESDAKVYLPGAQPMLFEHPIISSVDGDNLTIKSAKRSKTTLALDKIQRVDVSQFERGQTTVAVSVLSLVAAGLICLVLFSSLP
jgi:hypothetical protein